ncbi:MAG: T9SS type A sorting domain-containing protein [Mesoflavibacter sp.]|nr:T9SS type A sorting domain-containing protein [Mesoflavibacter sp.]
MSKKIQLLIVLSLISIKTLWSQSEVFISELCDPQSNYANDRFIEIYNAGSSQIDLTGWTIVAIGNGNDIFTWDLSGNIQPNEALVAGNITTTATFNVDFADDGWSGSNGSWNGKVGDGAKLLDNSGTIVDYIEVPSTVFENKDLVRNPDILTGNTTYTSSEWAAASVTLASDASPGAHYVDQEEENPSITDILFTPTTPIEGDDITISATVIDTDTTISEVVLNWGLSSTNLNNTINLSIDSGNIYTTDSTIPSQTGGTTIYYSITATNANSDSTTTNIFEIYIPLSLDINVVQGGVQSSYVNQEVVITGVVMSTYNDYYTVQDNTGEKDGIWIVSSTIPSIGNSVQLKGRVSESVEYYALTTFLTQTEILSETTSSTYSPTNVTIPEVLSNDDYEGVTVTLSNVVCSSIENSYWTAEDLGGTTIKIGDLGIVSQPVLGTEYNITGAIIESNGEYYLQPRTLSDIVWVSDTFAPVINNISILSSNDIEVEFSEELEPVSAETATNYSITGQSVISSTLSPDGTRVVLEISTLSNGEHTLTVDQVDDIYGNTLLNETFTFNYVASNYPDGYYDPAIGLQGQVLRQALHDIIDNHTVKSYDFAWTAYYTTDIKPNGKVWDIYSDTPGQTPPYEYDFGVDEGGIGGGEGNGYTREHSWPKSWYGGEVTPMYSDIFALYPCDAHVNGNRGNYPYGEVDTPEWTSLNGSKRGTNTYPGYTGTVFEPIDEYKGDLARTYFYMSTRYFGEDAGWPGSDMVNGAELEPWAVNMLLEWHENDPVSQKEVTRNNAVYAIQANRNPFIDHPEWVECIWGESCTNLSINDVNTFDYTIYPNPAIDFVNIKTGGGNNNSIDRIEIYDATGKFVKVYNEIQNNRISISQLEEGIYFLKFYSRTSINTEKIIIH